MLPRYWSYTFLFVSLRFQFLLTLEKNMGDFRFWNGKMEPLYNTSRPYHNGIIVWWAVSFMFWKPQCFLSRELMISLLQTAGASWDTCVNFGYPEQLEVLPLSCLQRCSDIRAVIYNPALVTVKRGLKWQHEPSAPCGRCKNRPTAAGSAMNFTFVPPSLSLFFV